jgi:ankyrin repeat protein
MGIEKLIVEGNLEKIKWFEKQGYNLLQLSDGYTLLYFALKEKKYKIADYLIEKGVGITNSNESYESTDFQHLVRECETEIIEFLFKYHKEIVPVNHIDKNGFSALYDAVRYGKTEMTILLLQNGAKLSSSKKNILERMFQLEMWDVLKYIDEHINQMDEEDQKLYKSFRLMKVFDGK